MDNVENGPRSRPRRKVVLAILGIAPLVGVLDTTIVTIALPTIREALGFPEGTAVWVLTAYSLAFGGTLLLAGVSATSRAAGSCSPSVTAYSG